MLPCTHYILARINVFMSTYNTGGESGSADTVRDPRGFAVKFYTEEGNWDLVGNNTPIFFIRDPLHVSDDDSCIPVALYVHTILHVCILLTISGCFHYPV